jgi:hypothetical protein
MSAWDSETESRIEGFLSALNLVLNAEELQEDGLADENTDIAESEDGEMTPLDGEPEEDPLVAIQAQFDTLQTALDTLKTDTDTLKNNDNVLKTDIFGLQTTIKGVDFEWLKGLSTTIHSLQSKVSYLQSSMGLTGNSAADASFANPPPSSIVGE